MSIELAVNGTLMKRLELNQNLLDVGEHFIRETATEPTCRLWSISDRYQAMIRVASWGAAIAVEVRAVPPRISRGDLDAGAPWPLHRQG